MSYDTPSASLPRPQNGPQVFLPPTPTPQHSIVKVFKRSEQRREFYRKHSYTHYLDFIVATFCFVMHLSPLLDLNP